MNPAHFGRLKAEGVKVDVMSKGELSADSFLPIKHDQQHKAAGAKSARRAHNKSARKAQKRNKK